MKITENKEMLLMLFKSGIIRPPQTANKPLEYHGYIGSSEPQSDGSCRGQLVEINDFVGYEGKDREELEANFRAAVNTYCKDCVESGRFPDLRPEPFHHAQGRDVLYQADIRQGPSVRLLTFYSIREEFLRARVGEIPKARTVSAWCLLDNPDLDWKADTNEIANETAAWLDRYGWFPCPGWNELER